MRISFSVFSIFSIFCPISYFYASYSSSDSSVLKTTYGNAKDSTLIQDTESSDEGSNVKNQYIQEKLENLNNQPTEKINKELGAVANAIHMMKERANNYSTQLSNASCRYTLLQNNVLTQNSSNGVYVNQKHIPQATQQQFQFQADPHLQQFSPVQYENQKHQRKRKYTFPQPNYRTPELETRSSSMPTTELPYSQVNGYSASRSTPIKCSIQNSSIGKDVTSKNSIMTIIQDYWIYLVLAIVVLIILVSIIVVSIILSPIIIHIRRGYNLSKKKLSHSTKRSLQKNKNRIKNKGKNKIKSKNKNKNKNKKSKNKNYTTFSN